MFNDALSGDLGNRPVAAIESVASTHRLESVRSRLIVLFHETWKYLLVSVAALAVDYALLAGLTRVAGVEWQIAAAAKFYSGALRQLCPQRYARLQRASREEPRP